MVEGIPNIQDLKKYPNRMVWKIIQTCNFSCAYCMNKFADTSNTIKCTPEKISSFFNNTGLSWLLMITGGEPFIYPGFVDLCKELEVNNYLQITTNLSTTSVYDFADRINPERIFLLSASYHFIERNNRNLIDDFFEKCDYLKKRGFKVVINYIAHPQTMDRMEEDLAHFESMDIPSFVVVLRGEIEGKKYPESYTEDELNKIKKYLIDSEIELNSAFGKLNYHGYYCSAGKNYFVLDHLGNLSRCSTLENKIGNMFEEEYIFESKIKPCIVTNCNDVICGAAAVTTEKASFYKTYLEKKAYKKQH